MGFFMFFIISLIILGLYGSLTLIHYMVCRYLIKRAKKKSNSLENSLKSCGVQRLSSELKNRNTPLIYLQEEDGNVQIETCNISPSNILTNFVIIRKNLNKIIREEGYTEFHLDKAKTMKSFSWWDKK